MIREDAHGCLVSSTHNLCKDNKTFLAETHPKRTMLVDATSLLGNEYKKISVCSSNEGVAGDYLQGISSFLARSKQAFSIPANSKEHGDL